MHVREKNPDRQKNQTTGFLMFSEGKINTFLEVLQSGVKKKLWFQLEKKNFTFFLEVRLGTNGLRDRIQILLLILSELKQINFYSPEVN